jgi:hypothetical protein
MNDSFIRSGNVAPTTKQRFANRRSASRPFQFFLRKFFTFHRSAIERLGWRWLELRVFIAPQGHSWGQRVSALLREHRYMEVLRRCRLIERVVT